MVCLLSLIDIVSPIYLQNMESITEKIVFFKKNVLGEYDSVLTACLEHSRHSGCYFNKKEMHIICFGC